MSFQAVRAAILFLIAFRLFDPVVGHCLHSRSHSRVHSAGDLPVGERTHGPGANPARICGQKNPVRLAAKGPEVLASLWLARPFPVEPFRR